MQLKRSLRWRVVLLALAVAWSGGCQPGQESDVGTESDTVRKIPVTTTSQRARRAFLEGRQLAEDLKVTEARPFFQRAVALDPSFAQAWLALATSAGTAQDFFAALKKAVERADRVSAGERHMILGLEAGANSDLVAQYEHYRALVRLYPQDERARLLLGTYFFGRQEYDAAIEQFQRATAINREFAPAFNQLGYAYRFAGRYEEAEAALQRYIELLPDQPNPYDSYAELMMKEGRFEESIRNYRIALEKDPQFLISYRGIGYNQLLMGRYDQARETLADYLSLARNDGERRQALFWTAVSYLDQGESAKALRVLEQRARLAAAAGDVATQSGDAVTIGIVLMEAGDLQAARERFDESADLVRRADVSADVRATALRNLAYQHTLLALRGGDLQAAVEAMQDYAEGVAKVNVPFEVRRLHELRGRIAWARHDASTARHELELANPRDPRALYLLAQVCADQGDRSAAERYARLAAEFNAFSFNYAFVRADARKLLQELQQKQAG
jgi:tetratricopeptide (TPR) repeat protein